MKKYILPLCAALLSIICGCSDFAGEPITKDFTIDGPFTELIVRDSFNVTENNEVDRITVTAGENIMPKVVVENVDGTLIIQLKRWGVFKNGYSSLKVTLPYMPDLKRIELSGASEMHAEYCPRVGEGSTICLSGGSVYTGSILSQGLELVMSGASNANLTGRANSLRIDLSGASYLFTGNQPYPFNNYYGFFCNTCEGEMSGGSNACFHCDGRIKLNLSGASKLHYSGNATTGDCRVSGGSTITHDTL